jgi:hypothetical protein
MPGRFILLIWQYCQIYQAISGIYSYHAKQRINRKRSPTGEARVKSKNIITVVLLVFVAASVVYLMMREAGQSTATNQDTAATATAGSAEAAPADRVIAYYFHGHQRCPTCRKIEAYTTEAIQTGFPEELAAGTVTLQVVNVDEPVNEHFITDFQLTAKTVVLVNEQDGEQVQWKNLARVWDLVGNKESFITYIREETRAMLEASA